MWYASEFMGFAAFTQEVVLNPENPSAKVDAELILASRQQEQSNNINAAMAAAGRRISKPGDGLAHFLRLPGGNSGSAELAGWAEAKAIGELSQPSHERSGGGGTTESVESSVRTRTDAGLWRGKRRRICNNGIQEFREPRATRRRLGVLECAGGLAGVWRLRRARRRDDRPRRRMPKGVQHQPAARNAGISPTDNAGLDARSYSLTGIEAPKPITTRLVSASILAGR